MDVEKVNEVGREILKLLHHHRPGQTNQQAIDEISSLSDQAIYASDDHPYVNEKASSIKKWSQIMYSPRKHLAYRSGSESGANQVRSFANGAATTLSHWNGKLVSE